MEHEPIGDAPGENNPASSSEGAIVEISAVRPLREEPPQRENLRGYFAGWLLAAFLFQVAAAVGTAIALPTAIDNVLKVLSVVLTPTVAILGTVTGFYFGAKPKGDRD